MKNRQTTDVIVGGVIGPITAPRAVVAGQWRDGELIVVGRSTTLTACQSQTLGELLEPADQHHPWPDNVGTGHFGSGNELLTNVKPQLVVGVTADTGTQAGRHRHPLRYIRPRPELSPYDIERAEHEICKPP